MTRSLRLLLGWGFDALDLEVVHWRAVAGNWASRRAAWKVGFRVEGLVRGLLPDRTGTLDAWIGSLRRDEPLEPAHPWHTPPELAGDGVRLRGHRDTDVMRIAEAGADARTQLWLPQLPSPYTMQDAVVHVEDVREQQAAGRSMFWAVTPPDRDDLAGEVGLVGLAAPSGAGELGYWAHPDARGRGLTSQAVHLAARYALRPVPDGGLGLRRLVIRVAEGNTASEQVALRAGFQPSGTDRDAELLRDGTAVDLRRYDLTATDLT
jgi:RimJ/RimL family protein N-acetyltransferase